MDKKPTVGEQFISRTVLIIRDGASTERNLFIIPRAGMTIEEVLKHTTSTAPKHGFIEIEVFGKRYVALQIKKRFVDLVKTYQDYRRVYFSLNVWFTTATVNEWWPDVAAEVKKILEQKKPKRQSKPTKEPSNAKV